MTMKPMLWLTALALLPATAAPMLGQPQPLGSEFSVNSNTESKQHTPVAAFNAAGSALVVWENDKDGLRGRLYGRDGSPLSPELGLVANRTLTTVPAQGIEILRKDPSVAFLPSGEFLLAWTEERDQVSVDLFIEHLTVLDRDVFAQKFSAAGAPEGTAVRLNVTTAGFQSLPKVLVRNGADAVVVWQSDDQTTSSAGDGIYGRLVHPATGQPSSGEMKLSSVPGLAGDAAIAASPNGGFAVSWEAADANSQGIFVRLFSKMAVAQGAEFRVNTTVAGLQIRPSLAPDPNTGGWLVVWQGQAGGIQISHIYGQFVGAGGTLVGPEFRVAQGVAKAQISPSVACVAGKQFLVTWLDYQDWFPVGLLAVEVDKLGRAVGSEVEINTDGIGSQTRTSIAVSPFGDVLLPWEGYTSGPNAPVISARELQF
jgi:large repetitive protein